MTICYCNKMPETGCFINNWHLFPIVLESGSPRYRSGGLLSGVIPEQKAEGHGGCARQKERAGLECITDPCLIVNSLPQ